MSERALCEWAEKLTQSPDKMTRADIEGLQKQGFSQSAISDAAQVIGYFNYINRIADGLGVDLEDSMSQPIGDWHADKADFRELIDASE